MRQQRTRLSRQDAVKHINNLKDGTTKPSFIKFKGNETDKILIEILRQANEK
jgi:hypothetical protein